MPTKAISSAAADERVPLDGLAGLPGDGAERLLIGASVYREPVDRTALLFQVGQHDWTAARAPDRMCPAPPYQAPEGLARLTASCEAAGLLIVWFSGDGRGAAEGGQPTVFVDRWTASELHRLLGSGQRGHEVTAAHIRAARYWQWRAAAWPQGRRADIHDLLEARHHLLMADEHDEASKLTATVCVQLRAWGDLGREAALIHDTLAWLPACSGLRAAWVYEIGTISQIKMDYVASERSFKQALEIFAAGGDGPGISRSYHSLGVLAQAQGDYAAAERCYQRSAWAQAETDGGEPAPLCSQQ